MAELSKINGVSSDDISKVDGVLKGSISKFNGTEMPSGGATAGRWMVGGDDGKIYSTTTSDASSGWSELVDLAAGSMRIMDIAYGEDENDPTRNRWVIATDQSNSELAYCENDSNALSRNFTNPGAPKWTDVGNIQTGLYGVYGGPAIAWGNSVWVAGGNETGSDPNIKSIKRSTDGGSSWSTATIPQDREQPVRAVCYKGSGNDWFAALDSDILYSSNGGTSWTRALEDAGGVSGWFNCMAFNGTDTWVAAGNAGRIAYSTDNWSSADEAADSNSVVGSSAIYGIVYVGGSVNKFVVAANGGKIAYSSDGNNWTAATTGTSNKLNAIATDDTTIVAVGNSNTVLTSTNATSWTSRSGTSDDLHCIACDIIGSGMR